MRLADKQLAQQLERTEALACAAFVEARAALQPESKATWIEVDSTYAMFDTPDSPVTQSFGLGMFAPATRESIGQMASFFESRGAPPMHEVSPLAGAGTTLLLIGCGYEPFEYTSVMYKSPGAAPLVERLAGLPPTPIRIVTEPDPEVFVAASVKGWSEYVEYADLMEDLARVGAAREGGVSFLATVENEVPAGTAALCIHNGVALLAGASTIPDFRNRGVQRALLEARLAYAAAAGCELTMMCAEPGSASQRNAERAGFRIAYTRSKWRRKV